MIVDDTVPLGHHLHAANVQLLIFAAHLIDERPEAFYSAGLEQSRGLVDEGVDFGFVTGDGVPNADEPFQLDLFVVEADVQLLVTERGFLMAEPGVTLFQSVFERLPPFQDHL